MCVNYGCGTQIANKRHVDTDIKGVMRRVRGEFDEMPDLQLTATQAQRFWALDAAACDAIFRALVDGRFLTQTASGAFIRRDVNSPRN